MKYTVVKVNKNLPWELVSPRGIVVAVFKNERVAASSCKLMNSTNFDGL